MSSDKHGELKNRPGGKLFETFVEMLLKNHLPDEDEMFLSEDDFKFSLGQVIRENLESSRNVILEYPVENKLLGVTKGNKSNRSEDRSYIDVYFEQGDYRYFIELKYVTAQCNCYRHGKPFTLMKHGAQLRRLFQIYKDIERMEKIKKDKKTKSFVFVITNDRAFWGKHEEGITACYSLRENDENGYYQTNKNFRAPHYTKNVEYNPNNLLDCIANRYPIVWQTFKTIKKGKGDKDNIEFKYLIIDLNHRTCEKDCLTESEINTLLTNPPNI